MSGGAPERMQAGDKGASISRVELEGFLLDVLSDQGPWLLDPHESSSFRFERVIEPDRLVVGLLLTLGGPHSDEESGGGRVIPLVSYKKDEEWYHSIGLEAFYSWAGYYLAKRVMESPEALLGKGGSILKEISSRAKWLPSSSSSLKGTLEGYDIQPSREDETDAGWVKSLLDRLVKSGAIRDLDVKISLNMALVLGRWGAEEFRRDYGLPIEFTEKVSDAARREASGRDVSTVSEFVLVGRLLFSADWGEESALLRVIGVLRGVGFELKGSLAAPPRMVEKRITLGETELGVRPGIEEDLSSWLQESKKAIRRILVSALESDIAPTA